MDCIEVSGAREHNLKSIGVSIPHGKHTVISGVSGSGKSTLAYDVIYATGQKQLLDCFSEQTKLFTSQLKQPDINYIKGLTPVISLKQHEPRKNPRATIGTLSEVSTYLRYLFSLVGQGSCPLCQYTYPVRPLHHLLKDLEKLSGVAELQFPVYKSGNKKYEELFSELRSKGYRRIEVDGVRSDLRDWIHVEGEPTMMVVAKKIDLQNELSRSDIQAVQSAVLDGHGFFRIVPDSDCSWFFKKHGCPEHGMVTADILPSYFSFNDLGSGCEDCHGAGVKRAATPVVLVQNKDKTLRQGPFFPQVFNNRQPYNFMQLYSLAKFYGFSFEEPFDALPDYAKDLLFNGSRGETFPLLRPQGYDKELPKYSAPREGTMIDFEGLVPWINRLYRDRQRTELSDSEESFFNRYMVEEVCPTCRGTRLKPQRELITIQGLSYHGLGEMELGELSSFLDEIDPGDKANGFTPILHELKSKLDSLIKIGLGYLSLNRRADTLSGGEYQRVRLAGQIGSDLMGLTYIIDEPTVGLHGADNEKIITLLEDLCAQGNTVITVEHDLDIIRRADYIIEMGPGAGVNGGEVIAQGSFEEVMENPNSILARFQSVPARPRVKEQDKITILGAQANNLKNIDVSIPLNSLVCLTGVSGSGKSSLAIEILYKALWSSLHDPRVVPGKHRGIEGMEKIQDVYCIDQSSMGRSKRSSPATYIGVFDRIRSLFAACQDAIDYGLDNESYYSFNSRGGCASCKGKGYLDTHIHYLGDLETLCPECKGQRYTAEVLDVKYNGKNISQVLELDFDAALTFFLDDEYISHKLKYVCELGLGYMKLGQPTSTISGGEAQRLCLAKEISKIRGKKNMLYIMDEPTTGLHSQDIQKLLAAMRKLIDKGNSMVVIEHNPDVIVNAGHIIDIGPGPGKAGGEVVAAGILEEILACPRSKTGTYLRGYLGGDLVR